MQSEHDEASRLLAQLAPRLVHFRAVGRLEHVTRAGEVLRLPQPTLSRSIARLEQQLGVPLFARRGRTVLLTPAGSLLLRHVEAGLAQVEAGVRAVTEDTSPVSGRIALGFLHTLGSSVVPRLVRGFRASRPGIRFELVQGGNELLLGRLRDGSLDLCLTSPLPDEPGVSAQSLTAQELVLVVPEDHRFAGRRRIALAAAGAEQFVGLGVGYGLRTITDDLCRQAGFTPRLVFTGEEIDTVRGLVAAGLGVALLPRDARGPAPDTVELVVTEPRATRTIGAVWLAGRQESPPVHAFREFVLSAGLAPPDLSGARPAGRRTGPGGQ